MNKTVTINISGIIFHIEEDAYESLSKYLITIKGYFSKTDGGNEIMSDIEARIAELLQQKINASKQVVLMMDVDHVKSIMGKPEEFGGEQTKEETKSGDEQANILFGATDSEHLKRCLRHRTHKASRRPATRDRATSTPSSRLPSCCGRRGDHTQATGSSRPCP